MRIRTLKLIRYGKFTERCVELPQSAQDIHLIVGANEAGKSTCRAAIADWLFGIPARTPMAFLHPMPELRLGGVLEQGARAENPAAALAFERSKGNKNTLRTPQDQVLADSLLQPWLGGLDQAAYTRMYSLDHGTLIQGGAEILSASDDLGRMLFQSASGMEHLGQLLQRLQSEEDALWAPRKSSTREYYIALNDFEQAQAELKHQTLRTRDWKTRHQALLECEQALDLARQQHAQTRVQIARLERIRRVQPLLQAIASGEQQLQALLAAGPAPLLDEDAAARLSAARQAMALAQADIRRHQTAITEAQQGLAGIAPDQGLLALEAEISDLNERRLQYRAHRSDMLKRQEELRLLWQRVQQQAGGLGWSGTTPQQMAQRLPAQGTRMRLNRLLKGRGALNSQLQTVQDQLLQRQQEIAALQQNLLALGSEATDSALPAALEQALKLGDPEAACAEYQVRLQRGALEIEAALAALGQWRMTPTALAAIAAPDADTVQALLNQQRLDALAEKSLQEALADKQAGLGRARLELDQLLQHFQPVSQQQVRALRNQRDAGWDAIKAAPQALPQLAAGFEQQVRQADQLADTRLDKLQYDADRQTKTQRLEGLAQDIVSLQSRLQALQLQIDAGQQHWRGLTAACGLPPLPLQLAPGWLGQRVKVLDLARAQQELEQQQQGASAAGEQSRLGLWAALAPQAGEQEAPALSTCVRMARQQITQADQARGQRLTLGKQLDEARANLPALQHGVASAQAAWQEWQAAWLDAVATAGYPQTVFTDRVEAELEVMEDIDQLLLRMAAIQSERIDTMQADLDHLARQAQALAQRLAPDLLQQTAEEIVLSLQDRLAAGKRAQLAADGWQARLAQASDGLTGANLALSREQAQLQPLLAVAGTADIAALAQAIARSEQRRALEKALAQAQSDLQHSADGLTPQQLRAEVAQQDSSSLLQALERLNQQAEEILEQVSQLSHQHGVQKSAFAAHAGDDLAARAEAQKQEALTRMTDTVERYLRTHAVARLLKWSMEKFRETKQGPMLYRASAMFNTLTLGSFSRLLVDSDGQTPRLFGVRADGRTVDVAGMSEGTRDQLYLALRLAALALQIDQGYSMPLIADDLFINFDDQRTAAGLQVLAELSRSMQVVFLTHHDHLLPLAREVLGKDLNVVML